MKQKFSFLNHEIDQDTTDMNDNIYNIVKEIFQRTIFIESTNITRMN